jgi:hypothetical protein
MNREDKVQLRLLRDEIEGEDDKRILRKALNHMEDLERGMQAIRVFAKAIDAEASGKSKEN